jgi:hypothetical protein
VEAHELHECLELSTKEQWDQATKATLEKKCDQAVLLKWQMNRRCPIAVPKKKALAAGGSRYNDKRQSAAEYKATVKRFFAYEDGLEGCVTHFARLPKPRPFHLTWPLAPFLPGRAALRLQSALRDVRPTSRLPPRTLVVERPRQLLDERTTLPLSPRFAADRTFRLRDVSTTTRLSPRSFVDEWTC